MEITAFKPLLLAVLFASLPAIQSGAATVLIMIIESRGNPEAASNTAGVWEGGMMDVFFDAGHIVYNAPSSRILTTDDDVPDGEARYIFEEAERNGADYFIVVRLDYPGGEVNGIQKSERVSLKLYKIHPYGVLYDKELDTNFSAYETLLNAKKAAMILTPYLRGGS